MLVTLAGTTQSVPLVAVLKVSVVDADATRAITNSAMPSARKGAAGSQVRVILRTFVRTFSLFTICRSAASENPSTSGRGFG